MPIFTIGILIVLSTGIFLSHTQKIKSQEFYSIGSLQSNIIKSYFELEKIYFYYEKFLEYNEYKAIKEFSENGGIPETCNNKWKFNSDCEPDFKKYFKEILNEKIESKEIEINSEIEIYFTDFNFPTGSNSAEVNYEGKIIVKKQSLLNFNDLEQLKSSIKDCIQNNKISVCNPESNTGNVYKFRQKVADILDENLESEEIFMEFEIDIKNSGLRTSIF